MGVTLTELADRLNLSPMTVSRALRGVGRMQPQTRQRVIETAREYGYRPNTSARAMRTGRSGCVALVLSSSVEHSTLPQQLVWGIEDAVEAQNAYLALCRLSDADVGQADRMPKLLKELVADGLLLNYTHSVPKPLIEQIRTGHVPAIWINTKMPHDCVFPDDVDAGYRLTKYLLDLGHRRIAYGDVYAPLRDEASAHYSVADRRAGYLKAMAEAKLPPREWRVPADDKRYTAAATQLLGGRDRPTAVVSYNGDTARPVMEAAALLGLEVPRDLSVVSVDVGPIPMFDRWTTTLVLPEQELGRTAVRMLLEKIANPTKKLPATPVVGELLQADTTAPPPRK